MINTVVLAGEVKRVELNTKPTRKGPAAMIMLQYGPNRQRTDQAVQFLHVALVRIPPYLYEKCKDQLVEGVWVDMVGHVQGVYKQSLSEGFVNNELVADRLQIVSEQGDDVLVDEDAGAPGAPAGIPD